MLCKSNDLAILRSECRLTQYQLAQAAKLNQSTVSRRLSGKLQLSADTEARLMDVLERAAAERERDEFDLALGKAVRESWPLIREKYVLISRLNEWRMTHLGEFIVIHEDEVVGFFPDLASAFAEGMKRYGLNPFLVERITPGE